MTKAGYTVTYHYSDDGSWESEHARKETGYGISGSDILYDMDQNRSYNGKTYAPDHKKRRGIVFGASEGKVSVAAEDNTVDIYYALDENGPDQFGKENAEFAGWKMSDDASGKLIEAGRAFVMLDHDVTLVAQ